MKGNKNTAMEGIGKLIVKGGLTALAVASIVSMSVSCNNLGDADSVTTSEVKKNTTIISTDGTDAPSVTTSAPFAVEHQSTAGLVTNENNDITNGTYGTNASYEGSSSKNNISESIGKSDVGNIQNATMTFSPENGSFSFVIERELNGRRYGETFGVSGGKLVSSNSGDQNELIEKITVSCVLNNSFGITIAGQKNGEPFNRGYGTTSSSSVSSTDGTSTPNKSNASQGVSVSTGTSFKTDVISVSCDITETTITLTIKEISNGKTTVKTYSMIYDSDAGLSECPFKGATMTRSADNGYSISINTVKDGVNCSETVGSYYSESTSQSN